MQEANAIARTVLCVLIVGCSDKVPYATPQASGTSTTAGAPARPTGLPTHSAPRSSAVPTQTGSPGPTASIGSVERIAAQHILIAWRGARRASGVTRTKPEAKAFAEDVLRQVKAGGDFSELATKYTDDKGSRDRAGSVGTFRREDMDPKFTRLDRVNQTTQIRLAL